MTADMTSGETGDREPFRHPFISLNEGAVVRRIAVDLYPGAHGLTLRIDLQSRDELMFIVELFKDLATGASRERVIEEGESFSLSGLDALRLLLDERRRSGQGCDRRLMRVGGSGQIEFVWVMDREGWRRCAALADHFYRRNESGHQFLSQEGADDRPVELAYEKKDLASLRPSGSKEVAPTGPGP